MGSANERWRYNVTSSLIGCAHTQNDPCITYNIVLQWTKLTHQGKDKTAQVLGTFSNAFSEIKPLKIGLKFTETLF